MPAGNKNFRHFILGLLLEQPMSGYDIKQHLESITEHVKSDYPNLIDSIQEPEQEKFRKAMERYQYMTVDAV